MARQEPEQFSTDIVNPAADNSDPHAGSFYVSVKVKPRLPDFLNSVNLKYVKLGYGYLIAHGGFYFLIAAVILGGAELRKQLLRDDVVFLVGMLVIVTCIAVGLTPRSTYLLDFACYRPPNHLKISRKEFIDLAIKSGNFNDAAIEFQRRVLDNSGIGDETYMPMTVFKPRYNLTLLDGREEATMAMFGAINDLLVQTKIRTKDIKILIVNCGVLNTTPSLSSMVVNHFKMRNDIQSFNLGGMGCSAGIIAIDLANDLLSVYPGSYAMVVSTEAVTYTWYKGSDLSMLLPNCFFRMGAAALLLSNSHRMRWQAKYELKQLVRTHKGMDDESFKCVRLREDARGRQGISVGGSVIGVGSHALQHNIASLSNLLHLSPHRHFFSNTTDREEKIKLCNVPNCALAFDHVCVLAAGKRVLDDVQSELGVREEQMEPSRRTLERFGNTSSSSVWYQLAFLEAGGKIKRSDRILQIAFGSGFKCNSAVFKALRTPSKPRLSPWYGGDGVLMGSDQIDD